MWGIDMSKVYLDDSTLTGIADAIRAKTGGSGLITPANMPTAIGSISGGGSVHTAAIYPFSRTTLSTTGHVSTIGSIKMKDYVTDFSKLIGITLRCGYSSSSNSVPGTFTWTKGMGQFEMAEYFSDQPFLNNTAKSFYVQSGYVAFPLITDQPPVTSTTGVMDTTAIGTGRVYLVVPNTTTDAIRVPIRYSTCWEEIDYTKNYGWVEALTGLWLTWED